MDALADRNLLFGLLALQNGMIDQSALILAFSTWTRDKARPLAEILLEQRAIDEDDRAALSAMAARHLKRHGDAVGKTLAAVPAARSLHQSLAALADTDVDATLGRVSASSPTEMDDAEATGTYGAPTGDGRRFRILRPHARGGLGEVFVALDDELHREVALKQILDHHADDPASRIRFVLEAEITGGLEHPGIVPVYGLGSHDDGRPYYAMRFIRGDSLKEAIAAFHADESLRFDPGKRTLALRRLLRRFVDVCNAIEYAHSRGVLHRDIKPANVIVGKHGETLVVDWGLAKAMGHAEVASATDERTLMPSSSNASTESLPGAALGTPAYMSPEQASGNLERLGRRSDVYSLGATLYCLLTGKAPFERDDLGAILRAVQDGSFAKPREVEPEIDRALEAVCLKAMATDPADRYDGARALGDDVERWAADEPTSAWSEPFSVRARRWRRRNRSAVMAAAASVVVALVGLAGVLAIKSRANEVLTAKNAELDRANRREAEANEQLREANVRVQARFDLAREAIRSFQAGVNEDDMLKGQELKGLRDKLLRGAAGFYEKLETLLKGQADRPSRAILAQSYFELGELTEKIGVQPEALAVHRKALAIRRELAAPPGADDASELDLARSLHATGLLAEATGDYGGALSAYEEARGLARPLTIGPGATREARDLLGLGHQSTGWLLSRTGKRAEAMESYRSALTIFRRLADEDSTDTRSLGRLSDVHNRIGVLQSQTGQMAEALESARRSLEIRQELADDHPAVTEFQSSLAMSHNNMGLLQDQAEQSAEALKSYQRALAIEKKLADDHPAVTEFKTSMAAGLLNIGWLLSRTGKHAEAMAAYLESAAIRRKLAEDNPEVVGFRDALARSLQSIGFLHDQTGRPDEAMAAEREAVAIQRGLVADYPAVTGFRRSLARLLLNLGYALARSGRPLDAMESFREALTIQAKLVKDNPDVTDYQNVLAETYLSIGFLKVNSGHPADAVEDLAREADIREKLARDHPFLPMYRNDLANCLTNAATILLRIGRASEARGPCERAAALREPLARDHPETTRFRDELAETYLRFGQVREAEGDLAGAALDWKRSITLFESVPRLSGENTFYDACTHALLARLTRDDKVEAQSMALLWRAVGMGYRNPSTYRTETALDPLRARPDFRLLMMDLAFPGDVFAR
jgi:eukaryotic-like serine/threonine-protein kinase